MADEILQKFRKHAESLTQEFKENYWNKEGRELTEKEKFSIAFANGIEVEIDRKNNSLDQDNYTVVLKTKPLSIFWNGTMFVIMVQTKPALNF